MKKYTYFLLSTYLLISIFGSFSSFIKEENSSMMISSRIALQDLPNEVINHILSFVIFEEGQFVFLINKNFYDMIQDQEQKKIVPFLSNDLHPLLLQNKTSTEIYQIHRKKVKESLDDTYIMLHSFSGLYGTPYLDPSLFAARYGHDLLSDIYKIYPEIFNFMVSRGNTHALEIYELNDPGKKDFPEITPLLEELIARNNHNAAELKFNILLDPTRPDYNPIRLQAFIEEQLKKTDSHLWIERKYDGLMKGVCGYDQNPTAAIVFLDDLIIQGNLEAKHFKIAILISNEDNPYGIQPDLAYQLNEDLITQKYPFAYLRKMEGLIKGNDLYSKNISAAKSLITQEKGNPHVFDEFLESLNYIQIEDFDFIHQFIDEQIALKNSIALKAKYKGLLYAQSGYNQKIETEKQTLNDLKRQEVISLEQEQEGCQLLYEQARLTAEQFLLKQQVLGNSHAFKTHCENYSFFLQDPRYQLFIESQINQGNLKCINLRVWKLLYESQYKKLTKENLLLKQFIDKLHHQGHRYGSYLKALGLKFGALGFDMDDNCKPINEETRKQQARNFIIKNRIAF